MSADLSFEQLVEQMQDAYKEAESKMGQCNVLVIGKTGVGKSTLINSVFQSRLAETGVGYPVTQGIRRHTKNACPITVYDTPGLELDEQQIERVKTEVWQLLETQRKLAAPEHIHVIWYCLNHEAGRFEALEEDWIKSFARQDVPVILVLTQTLTRQRSDFLAFLEGKNLPACQIVPVLAEAKPLDDYYTIAAHGLERLVEVTAEILPKEAKKAFLREQIRNIDLKANEAVKYVSGYVASSALVGATPIPFADAPILMAMQAAMIANITAIFGLDFQRELIVTVLTAISSVGSVAVAGRTIVANLLKLIPGAGTALGGAVSGTTAATLTLVLGLAYIQALKIYVKSQIEGIEIPLAELGQLIVEQYKYYAQTGQKTLSDENLSPPRQIDIT